MPQRYVFVTNRSLALAIGVLLLATLTSGCRGRAEFRRGHELLSGGDYREAYRKFWFAYQLSPSDPYRQACRDAALAVTREEEHRARSLEATGELHAALAAYALALEYDPDSLTLREGHARLWAEYTTWQTMEDAYHRAPGRLPWRRLRILREMVRSRWCPPEFRREFRVVVYHAAELTAGPLRRQTLSAALSMEVEELASLGERWDAFSERCRSLIAEARDLDVDEALMAESSRVGERSVNTILTPYLQEAAAARLKIDAAIQSRETLKRAQQAAASGDEDAAITAYRQARLLHPKWSVAADAEVAFLRRRQVDTFERAERALAQRQWVTALGHLESLLKSEPNSRESEAFRRRAMETLREAMEAESERSEHAGNPATALLYLSLSRHGLQDNEATVLQENANSRAVLMARVQEILSPPLQVLLRRVDPQEWRLRRDLWGVDDEDLQELEATLLRSLRRHAPELVVATTQDLARPERRSVTIDELEFSLARAEIIPGADRVRHVREFAFVDNDSQRQARERLVLARWELGRVRERHRQASLLERTITADLLDLAHWRVEQLENETSRVPSAVVEVGWAEFARPTRRTHYRAVLAARVVAREAAEWVRAESRFTDETASVERLLGLPADPPETPSRRAVLRDLSYELGEQLAERSVATTVRRVQERYSGAQSDLERGDVTRAIEGFALVYFGGRDRDDLAAWAEVARQRLEEIHGWWPPAQ